MIKRALDVLMVVASLPLVLPAAGLVAAAIWLADGRPILYWSKRVGQNNRLFLMPKFRTMRRGTPAIATHLMTDARAALIPAGGILRASSLDELPQLLSVLRGDMSLVGPRPALFNQDDLIALRTEAGVHALVPGITGWAQVNGRDDLPIPRKVHLESEYLRRRGPLLDMRILVMTITNVLRRKGVHH